MKQAAKEALSGNKSHYEKIKAIAAYMLQKWNALIRKAMHLFIPQLWLRKIFPKEVFLNSNLPDKRYKIFKKKNEIDVLPDDSTDLFQIICLIVTLTDQVKILKLVLIKSLINFVLQSFFFTTIL